MNGTPNPMPVNTNDPHMEAMEEMVKDLEATIRKMSEDKLALEIELANTKAVAASHYDRAETLANRTMEDLVREIAEIEVEVRTDGLLLEEHEIIDLIENNTDLISTYNVADHVTDALNWVDLSDYGAMTESDVESTIHAMELLTSDEVLDTVHQNSVDSDGVADIISSMELVSRDDVEQLIEESGRRDVGDGMVRELLDRVEALESLVEDLASALQGWSS